MNTNNNFSPSNPSISIIVRLRGPKKNNNESTFQKHIMKPLKKTTSSPHNNSKNKITKNQKSKNSKNGLDPDTKYTIFTCKQPSKTLIISNKPLKGSSINEAFNTPTDLYDFSQSILKETSLLEFDKVYNEIDNLSLIYNETIKDNISNLFHGKNSSIFFFGPIDGGKSYLLRGNGEQINNEPGLLSRTINEILNLVELTRQSNQNSNKNKNFNIKFSIYQVYFDKIHDLLSREINQVKCENYYNGNNKLNTNFIGLTQREIKCKNDYDICMQDAIQQRKNLSQILKVNELKRKSNLIMSIIIEKKERININLNQANEQTIEKYSQINFIELESSNFGLIDDINENDSSLNGLIFRNTSNMFNSICDNIVSSIDNSIPKSESMLTLCLKDTLQFESNIVFFNCVIPWEYPLGISYKTLKFGNWLRNQVVNNFGNAFGKKIFPIKTEDNTFDNINMFNNFNYNNSHRSKGLKYINSDLNQRYIPNAVLNNDNTPNNNCDDVNNSETLNNNIISENNIPYNNQLNNNTINLNNNLNQMNPQLNNINPNQSIPQFNNINPINNNQINNIEPNSNYSSGFTTGISYNVSSPKNYYNYDCNYDENNIKIRLLEKTIRELEEQNCILNKRIDCLQCEQEKKKNEFENCKKNVCDEDNNEIEKIKKDYIEMKGDNLMYQEDIKRLSEMNKHLEDQIKEERNRNLELANNNENLLQENIQYKKDIQNLCNEVKNNKISNNTFEETYKQKNEAESKIKELLYNLNQLKEERDKFETDNRIIVERYNELEKEYDKLKCDYCLIKKNYECEMSMIENKINTFSSEIDNLQKENSNLRKNEEKLKLDYSNLLDQKNDINNLYTEQKNKNEILNMQIQNIQKDFEKLLKEKEMQDLLREKYLEEQRLKNESKAKLVNDLQNRIQNYRTERLKKKE